jgi:hypothetical protein
MRIALCLLASVLVLAPGCRRMPPETPSAKVGKFLPDIDPSDGAPLGLTAQIVIPGEGLVNLCLPAVEESRSRREWQAVVARVDADYDRLIERVVAARREIAPRVLELHKKSFFKKKWNGSADELMSYLTLRDINYYGDGTFAIWYKGDTELFYALDLNVELDRNWRIYIVKFDG